MNLNKIFTVALLISSLGLSSCYDLDRYPEGELSSVNAFTSTTEIQKYLNQFYQSSVIKVHGGGPGDASGIAFGDGASDNMSCNAIDTRLAGEIALSNARSISEYTTIRNVNFLIANLGNCQESGAEYNQCVGEAYYFRAALYYELLKKYGGVTYLTEVLEPIQEEMERPRNSRSEVADSILADLDIAIEKLNPQKNCASMRVHKDVARALKSEVALFEGTWEKYHKMKNTPFYDKKVSDEKIINYLQQSAEAAKAVIDGGVWKIFKGDPLNSYREMFITIDLSDNPEILWYKKYDAVNNISGSSVTRYSNRGGGLTGVTASLVDDYLTIDGRPFVGDERDNAKKIYGDELLPSVRDPRLSQTVCLPGQVMRPDFVFQFPPLDGNSFYQNTTGYSFLKHIETDPEYPATIDGGGKGQSPAIQFRYADILLNYAEALAELDGAANARTIQETLLPLRERVGMPGVDFDREYNTSSDYPFKDLNKYIQAVRRERRVEKALENTRLTDILRWAAADILIKDKTPIGALYVGSNLEAQFKDRLEEGVGIFLTGKPGDDKRYVIPYNSIDHPNGWQFNLDRDYLLPIEERMLSLTGNKWVQNPGW